MEVNIVERTAFAAHGMILVDKAGACWRTFSAEWWDLPKWIVWVAEGGPKKWVVIRKGDKTYRLRAVRLSKAVVYLGG